MYKTHTFAPDPAFPLHLLNRTRAAVRAIERERLNVKSRLFYILRLPAQSRRSKPLGLACAACFEQLACVFASCGAIKTSIQADSKDRLYIKVCISCTTGIQINENQSSLHTSSTSNRGFYVQPVSKSKRTRSTAEIEKKRPAATERVYV